MYDWDLDTSGDDFDFMTLNCEGIVADNDCSMFLCNINIAIYYEAEDTHCSIFYSINKNGTTFIDTLNMIWENTDSRILTLNKDVTTTSCFLFSKTTNKECELEAEDTRESSWCYFIDARYHLNRIAVR
jgi:hypothetical protein